MLVTEAGMVMLVRVVLPLKASAAMLVYNGEITSSEGEPRAT